MTNNKQIIDFFFRTTSKLREILPVIFKIVDDSRQSGPRLSFMNYEGPSKIFFPSKIDLCLANTPIRLSSYLGTYGGFEVATKNKSRRVD